MPNDKMIGTAKGSKLSRVVSVAKWHGFEYQSHECVNAVRLETCKSNLPDPVFNFNSLRYSFKLLKISGNQRSWFNAGLLKCRFSGKLRQRITYLICYQTFYPPNIVSGDKNTQWLWKSSKQVVRCIAIFR
jgi:hypothetical protein